MWNDIQPRRYTYRILPIALVRAFIIAYVLRLSGLRAVSERCARVLGNAAFNSIAVALTRASSLAFVRAMVERLQATHAPKDGQLVAIDGMALTLPRTQRHRCAKFNNNTVGGGVVWSWMIDMLHGASPLNVLKVVSGAWCDSKLMRNVRLSPNGPVYLMDRGFYALELLEQWLAEEVRFIVRVRQNCLVYKVLKTLRAPGQIGSLQLLMDAMVCLGGPHAKAYPVVRLIHVRLASGEDLILATDRMEWSTQRVLDSYKKRWHIERFHRLLKETLGLAHLYSFKQDGIEFLLYAAVLVTLLLVLARTTARGETVVVLHQALRELRTALGLGTPWKRNSCTRQRRRTKQPRRPKTIER